MLFHVIVTLLEIVRDPFGYFLDHVVPDKPPLILTPEQVVTASQTYPQGPNQCLNGAVNGVGEELVWSILLGPAGPLDMLLSAYIGCMMSGNTLLRARSYYCKMGRFLSADSVHPNAPGTQGYNRYPYTANNPTTWIGPSGQIFSTALSIVAVDGR